MSNPIISALPNLTPIQIVSKTTGELAKLANDGGRFRVGMDDPRAGCETRSSEMGYPMRMRINLPSVDFSLVHW